jgi:hypothetical protein
MTHSEVKSMGILNLLKRKRQSKDKEVILQESDVEETGLSDQKPRSGKKKEGKRPLKLNTNTERIGYVKDNCEIILESDRQIEEAKVEYQAVTSYLTDMQRIDMIPEDQRENLEEAARKIVSLSKDREKLQRKSSVLSDMQYRLFERYELTLPKELPAIKDSEQYQAMIDQDMMHLEKEREVLNDQEEEIVSKQSFLKGIAIATSIVIIFLFLLFALLSAYSEASFTIPFLLTVLMGMVLTLYIFLEARKNQSNVRIIQAKQNRQIMLMNKVKIKAVNNRSYLDYAYSKYMVENYEQLRTSWEEYVRMKDEARRYQSNTELLEFFHNELIHELKKYGVVDSEIWIYQPTAILDNKEMVEVRHRLNVRRQKLRERIDLNQKQRKEAISAIKGVIANYPDSKEEAEKLVRRYQLELEE